MDGGFAYPAYAQALANLCEKRGSSFAYLYSGVSTKVIILPTFFTTGFFNLLSGKPDVR